jgi:hypothetical protein
LYQSLTIGSLRVAEEESLVNDGGRRFLTPVPLAESYDALNAKLAADCRARQADCAGRNAETIGIWLQVDLSPFRDLLAAPFEACETRTPRASLTSLMRYRGNSGIGKTHVALGLASPRAHPGDEQ